MINQICLRLNTFIILFLVLGFNMQAQDEEVIKEKALVLNVVRPIIGEIDAGFLFDASNDFEFLIYARYNYARVPEYLYYYPGPYYSIDYNFQYTNDELVTGYTFGGQVRYTVNKNQTKKNSYKKYLKKSQNTPKVYVGIWLDHMNSILTMPFASYREKVGFIPDAKLNWNSTTGGILTGVKFDLGASIILDIHTGLGIKAINAEALMPVLEYDNNVATYTRETKTNQTSNIRPAGVVGIQIGYKF